jgi:hypothetical protein
MSVVPVLFYLRMMRNLDKAVAAFAAERHGVFDVRFLAGLGVTATERRWRVENGRWERVYDGVYRLAGAPLTWTGELLASCWAGGEDAVASHRSSCALFHLPGSRTDIAEITCPRWRRGQEDGLVVHESKALAPRDRASVDGIPTMSPELTLLTLGAVCSPLTVEMALDRALLRGLVTRRSVLEVLERHGRRGRSGVSALRAAMRARGSGEASPESPKETQLLWLLRQLGFPPPVPQYAVRHHGEFIGRLDAAYPEERIGLEYQSYEHHLGKFALDGDNARRRKFKDIGWDVVEVTPADFHDRGKRLSVALRAALNRSGVNGACIATTLDAKTQGGYLRT